MAKIFQLSLILIALTALFPSSSLAKASATTTQSVTATPINEGTKFIGYWFSWGQNNPVYQYRRLAEVPAGVNMVFVAYGLENAQHQLAIQITDPEQLAKFKQDVQTLHQKGIKVFLSTGGETGPYPWDDEKLSDHQVATQYLDFIRTYDLDGLDFDVEIGAGARIPPIVKILKQQKPNLLISLSVGSETAGTIDPLMESLAATLSKEGNLNYLDLMNYDQEWTASGCTYEDPNPASNCYIQNILATTKILKNLSGDETKAKQMLSNSIMIGYADDGKMISPDLVRMITVWLQQNGYGAVSIWGLSRDQSSVEQGKDLANTTGMVNLPPQIYTRTIIQALK